ncbi:hypothetical protein SAMN05216480_10627 [Pustulibacterium marinum]|uniref:Tim44-like domain-containing protein n=1 Tax=Pustulibacterium marinum TaxID=1224947 RepID=A0A1I7GVX4_9FLAO|nr:hypothetical protein [Pustulibacterium marinum]SFU52569.1 hypothetical protein SAMN05216480_10627 [Pustulibacterium marinum]
MKTKNYHYIIPVVVLIALLLYVEPVLAGPGGAIAKAFFKTWWGKMIMGILAIILLPFILYMKVITFFKVQKTKKLLRQLGFKNPNFGWLHLQKTVKTIFTNVYEAWSNEDMSQVQRYVNPWYWQNQQLVHLDRWKAKNQQNICNLDTISNIKPLYIEIFDEITLEGSKVVFEVSAMIEDYLIDRTNQKVVEGAKGYKDETHLWVFEYTEGKWLLENIMDEEFSFSYIKTPNAIPESLVAATR